MLVDPIDDNAAEGLETAELLLMPGFSDNIPSFAMANVAILDDEDLRGALHRQIYLEIPGASISDLTNSMKFPHSPDFEIVFPPSKAVIWHKIKG